jgi:hypothetical protein
MTRDIAIALGAIAVLAFALRIPPLLPGGPYATWTFDDASYYSSSALMLRGSVPYAEFTFPHPPGLLLVLAPFAWLGEHVLGHEAAFGVARWSGALIGSVSALLAGALAYRWRGPWAGLIAGALYATFGPAVRSDPRAIAEPYICLATLGSAWIWLDREGQPGTGRIVAAAALAGFASSVKVYGGLLVAVILLVGPFRNGVRERALVCAAAAAGALAPTLPFLALGGEPLVGQALLTQLIRPPDRGYTPPLERVVEMFQFGAIGPETTPAPLGAFLLALIAPAAVRSWRRDGTHGRLWAVTLMLTTGLFLLPSNFFDQHAAFVAPAGSILLGVALHDAAMAARRSRAFRRPIVIAILAFMAVALFRDVLRPVTTVESDEDAGARIVRDLPPRDCVFSDMPQYLVLAGRLPPVSSQGPIPDVFYQLTYVAIREGQRYTSQPDAIQSPAAQARLRVSLEECEWVVLSAYGSQRLFDPGTRAWFRGRFEVMMLTPGSQIAVWRQRPP